MEGGGVLGWNNTFEDIDEAAVSLSEGAYAGMTNMRARRNGTGMRVENSSFSLERPTFIDNNTGIDLHTGARGDINSGYLKDNAEADIRYNDYILVGLFDSVARSVQNLSDLGDGMMWVDQQWAASQILDTTEIQHKAQNMLKLARKTSRWSSRLRLAVKLAKMVLTG